MTEQNENIDSQNDDVEVETTEEETTTDETNVELSDREKQFLARAKKAEAKFKAVKDTVVEPKPELKKPNTEQGGSTVEHTLLIANGIAKTLDEIKIIEKVAKNEGIPLMEAAKDGWALSTIEKMRNEAQVKANTLPASNGSAPAPREKTVNNMTEDEHRGKWEDALKTAVNK